MKITLPDADIEYIEHFYSQQAAADLFTDLQHNLRWRQDSITLFGKHTHLPRLQAWYGNKNLSYCYSSMCLIAKPWTASLLDVKLKVSKYCQQEFNAVLANYYRHEKDSVAWHSDNEPELGTAPTIASLSLGASREFQLKHKASGLKKSLILSSGSLLIMRHETQQYWQHCLPKRAHCIAPRINLSFRSIMGQGR
ncbi:DNA-N1-methyladenine dioxygenase [Colwellia chukchiensis]|uniref:DNA-N1-methyladenine dioxygenase n=1 Tax=Colwellia chukchiensis TaxID=641665 RepID=A0A1H7IU45_9GAMM|nr:alpha-ketoglutarate-dependent dioxygenase AlkB [Colwellia chukchiensis]SEK66001.1 DNA-N1-methyladenine dioxygenase [Colwellia chukchiensis]